MYRHYVSILTSTLFGVQSTPAYYVYNFDNDVTTQKYVWWPSYFKNHYSFFYLLWHSLCCLVQNEIRSLVSLGDGAAGGGGSSGSGVTLVPRGTLSSLASGNPPGSGGVGGGGGTGESSSKRSGSGRTPTGASKKKKESSSGPMLFGIEWWRGEKVEIYIFWKPKARQCEYFFSRMECASSTLLSSTPSFLLLTLRVTCTHGLGRAPSPPPRDIQGWPTCSWRMRKSSYFQPRFSGPVLSLSLARYDIPLSFGTGNINLPMLLAP